MTDARKAVIEAMSGAFLAAHPQMLPQRMGAALSALLAALPGLGLKVVGMTAADDILIGIEGDWPSADIHGDLDHDDCRTASSDIYAAMVFCARNPLEKSE